MVKGYHNVRGLTVIALLGRYFVFMVVISLVSWVVRGVIKYYARRRATPPGNSGESSARIVEGTFRVKEEDET